MGWNITPTIVEGLLYDIFHKCNNWYVILLQQARAEQEEEFISNTLLKKIQALKKEKETLALNYEQEEECLTNDLSRKLSQVGLYFVLCL